MSFQAEYWPCHFNAAIKCSRVVVGQRRTGQLILLGSSLDGDPNHPTLVAFACATVSWMVSTNQ